jgi:hypothetical protein
MKKQYCSRLGLGLAGVLLAWSGGICSADLILDGFDTTNDVTAYTANIQGGGSSVSFSWDSAQNSPQTPLVGGSGSMYVTCNFGDVNVPSTSTYPWQEVQCPRPGLGVDMSSYTSADWYVMVDQAHSFPDMSGTGYSFSSLIFQYGQVPTWGNGIPGQHLTTVLGWQHFISIIPGGYTTISNLILDFNGGGWTSSPSNTIAYWIDGIKLLTGSGPPPTIKFGGPAIAGLNFWTASGDPAAPTGAGQFDRHGIYTGTLYNPFTQAPATLSFTVADFPTNAADTSYAFNFLIVGGTSGNNGAPDWEYGSVVYMTLQCNTNGIASWGFRWKTNWPNSNGNGNNPGPGFYFQNDLPFVTNPTPIGKWTLALAADAQTVTMTSPNGNSTNFVLGVAPDTDNLAANSDFSSGLGALYLDVMANNTTNADAANSYRTNFYKRCVISRFSVSENGGLSGFTNDFTTAVVDTNIWFTDMGDAQRSLFDVPSTNSYYLKWFTPDNSFALQTNNNAHNALAWSTNGVPNAITFITGDIPHAGFLLQTNRFTLIMPSTFPNSQYAKGTLLYRLAKPPF